MKKRVIIGIVIGIIVVVIIGVFIISYIKKECENEADCLTKNCFTVQCSNKKCVYSPITNCCGNEICEVGEIYLECTVDCPNCDDINNCTLDSYDYHEQKCVNKPILDVVCCGNGVCEIGETYEDCTRDCPNCDDENQCTEDSYDYHEQKCVNELIIPCCGNGICDEETAETYLSCEADCPNCNDDNECTKDFYDYHEQKCVNELIIPCRGNKECVIYTEKIDEWFGIGKICEDKNDCVAYRDIVYSGQLEVLELEVKCVAISSYERIEMLRVSCIDTQDCLEGFFDGDSERLENMPEVQQEGWKEVMMCRDNLCEATENFLKFIEAH